MAKNSLDEAINRLDRLADTIQREVVIDKRTGRPRQAGATTAEGQFIAKIRQNSEKSLHFFAKAIMGRDYLTKSLHLGVADWLQACPPFRKLLLMPREHAKTSIVSHCLPIHLLIQPKDANIYFPGLSGRENRILLAGETERMAAKNLSVVAAAFEGNELLRTFWPHVCWEKPRAQARRWNSLELDIPRDTAWPDPSVRAIGVGGAITGARPTVLIKDDLISVEAANSEIVMQTAIDWHRTSRALMEEYEHDTGLQALEFIIGTRWAVFDLYQAIMDDDPTVEVLIRRIIEHDKPIWPERINQRFIDQKKKEYGTLFWLLYMNSPTSSELVDFDIDRVRPYTLVGDTITFDETEDDIALEEKWRHVPAPPPSLPPRTEITLNADAWGEYFARRRGGFVRLRYG